MSNTLVLSPPYWAGNRSIMMEECCSGQYVIPLWSSKLSFIAERLIARGEGVRHRDLRFEDVTDAELSWADRIMVLASRKYFLRHTIEWLDALSMRSDIVDKLVLKAAMIGEASELQEAIYSKWGHWCVAEESRLDPSDHFPLGEACSLAAIQSCRAYYYSVASGCVYHCKHCPWSGHKEIWRPANMVASDIVTLSGLNPNHNWARRRGGIALGCSQINTNVGWLDKFSKSKISKGIGLITWSTDLNVMGLSSSLISILESAGCVLGIVGFDALNDDALRLVGKAHRVEDIIAAAEALAKSNILIKMHLLYGYGETPDMVLSGIDVIRAMRRAGFVPGEVKYNGIARHTGIENIGVTTIDSRLIQAHDAITSEMESYGWHIKRKPNWNRLKERNEWTEL